MTLEWPFKTFDPLLTFLADQKFQPVQNFHSFFILWLKFLSIVKIWISVYNANQPMKIVLNPTNRNRSESTLRRMQSMANCCLMKKCIVRHWAAVSTNKNASIWNSHFCAAIRIEKRIVDSDWPKMCYEQKRFLKTANFQFRIFFFFQNSFTIPVSLKIGKFFKSRYYTILYKDFYK